MNPKPLTSACDWLVFAAHPDDAELGMGGTLLKARDRGLDVVMVDWTRGELGTRGTAETRAAEAQAASNLLGLKERINLDLGDGTFEGTPELLQTLVGCLRRFRPKVVWGNAVSDRHPDHGRASALLGRAVFLSGLLKFRTDWEGESQEPWSPALLAFYIQDHYHKPDYVTNISDYWQAKAGLLSCYSSQFHQEGSTEPVTPISRPDFLPFIEARAREMGRLIGEEFGEGFVMSRPLGQRDLPFLI
ncbi:MAG: bacillithiol biosynthesis deacetylase BshB1 [Cytophagia bacterium]|nr:bacillithiol biosynthesis deacetylase BshB1 [Cytophagia bacterium]